MAASLKSVQSKFFKKAAGILSVPPSQAHKHLYYHPPNLNLLSVSSQDSSLENLVLKDTWLEEQKARQAALRARGKNVRVCVETGPVKPQDKADDGKKKKKRK